MTLPCLKKYDGRESRILAAFLVVLLIAPAIASSPYFVSIWTFIALNLIVVCALDLLVGYAGQLSLGQGVFVSVGAYVSAALTTSAGWSGWAAIPVGMAAAALLAVIIGLPALRLRGYYLAMVTLGFPVIFDAVMRYFSEFTGGSSGIISVPRLTIGGAPIRGGLPYYYLVLAFFAVVLLVAWVTVHSRWGVILRTIHADEALARAKGVPVAAVKVMVFTASAAAAAVAGSLYVHYVQFIAPDTFGVLYSIMVLAMVLVGGMGRVWGALVGAAVLMWIPELLRATSQLEPIVFGAALAAVMLFAPNGIAGLIRRQPRMPLGATAASGEQARQVRNAGANPLLSVEQLSKRFGGVTAVTNVNFSVRAQEIKAVIGPNGAGKSTLLALISGIIPNDSGRVVFHGQPIHEWPPNRRAAAGIARTFQHARLVPDLTIFENIRVGAFASARTAEANQQLAIALELVREFGLAEVGDKYPSEIDQFSCRLAEIASAVASNPELLLLDEPAAGLSEAEVERLLKLLRWLRHQGATIILVDHVMQLVLGIADSVVVLEHGEVIVETAAAELTSNERVRRAYLGEPMEVTRA